MLLRPNKNLAQNFDPVREWSMVGKEDSEVAISLHKCVVSKPLVCNENKGINGSI